MVEIQAREVYCGIITSWKFSKILQPTMLSQPCFIAFTALNAVTFTLQRCIGTSKRKTSHTSRWFARHVASAYSRLTWFCDVLGWKVSWLMNSAPESLSHRGNPQPKTSKYHVRRLCWGHMSETWVILLQTCAANQSGNHASN